MKESSFGARILEGMGWKEGTGLGAKRDGIIKPLNVARRKENLGVGAQRRPFKNAWWEKMMDDAYGKPKNEAGDGNEEEDLLDACEGRRCRPHGKSKLERLAKQDLAASGLQPVAEDTVAEDDEDSDSETPVEKGDGNVKTIETAPPVKTRFDIITTEGSKKFMKMAEEAGVTFDLKYAEKLDKLWAKQRLAAIEGERGLDGALLTDESEKLRRRKITRRQVNKVEKKLLKGINKAIRKKAKGNNNRSITRKKILMAEKEKRAKKLPNNEKKRQSTKKLKAQEKPELADDPSFELPPGL